MVKLLTAQGFEVIIASNRKNKLRRLYHMLSTIYRYRRNATVLLATYSTSAFNFAWLCAVLCKNLRIKYIPCLHGGNLPYRIKNSPEKCAQLFGNSYINVAVSSYLEKSILEEGWPCTVIPNYINIEKYSFKLRERCHPKLLWVRSFHEIYNPVLAVKVLHQLLESYPTATLTMVGPDKDGSLEQCRQLAQSLNIIDHIHFTGKLSVAEWTALSASHDIFINTSNFDNLPVSIIEAMALGLPIVSTNVGGIPYLVTSGTNGLLVPAGDENAMKDAVKQLLEDTAFTRKLSQQARAKATLFDYIMVAEKWTSLLTSGNENIIKT